MNEQDLIKRIEANEAAIGQLAIEHFEADIKIKELEDRIDDRD